MNETIVTLGGIVATDPAAKILDQKTPLTTFRMVSTSRRYDQATHGWVDGDKLWVTVTCWRALARNVALSVLKRDCVVVHGRLRVSEWVGDDKVLHTRVEVVADMVGHDMSWGTSVFTRARRVEPVEQDGRGEADELARQVELAALANGLDAADLVEALGRAAAPEDGDDDADEDELDDDLVDAQLTGA